MEKWCGQKKLSDINLVGVCIQTMKYFTGSGHISKVWLNFSNECRCVFCRYSFWWLSFVGKVFWLFLFAEICSRQNIYLYDSWKPLVDVSHGRPILLTPLSCYLWTKRLHWREFTLTQTRLLFCFYWIFCHTQRGKEVYQSIYPCLVILLKVGWNDSIGTNDLGWIGKAIYQHLFAFASTLFVAMIFTFIKIIKCISKRKNLK